MFPALPSRLIPLAQFSTSQHRRNVHILASNAGRSHSNHSVIPGADTVPSE